MDIYLQLCLSYWRYVMRKPKLEHRHSPVPYISYVVGFVLSVIATLMAYWLVVGNIVDGIAAVYVVMTIAIVQLVVQLVFFLHIGRGSRWKLLTFIFAGIFVVIVVVGTIWIMENLDYNMMHMSPEEMTQYMRENEGI